MGTRLASGTFFQIKIAVCAGARQEAKKSGGGDELVNRSYRDRAADDLGHRDVTRNLSREL